MDDKKQFYVYAYLRSHNSQNGPKGSFYYVGKGKGNRAFEKHNNVGVPPDPANIVFLGTNLTEADAFQAEMFLIFLHGRINTGTGYLRNKTDGGEGTSGLVVSAEARKKHSESMMGHPGWNKGMEPWNKGKQRSDWTDKPDPRLGSKASEETRQRLVDSHIGKTRSEESRKKQGATIKGHPSYTKGKTWKKTEEQRKRHSEAMKTRRKGHKLSPEHRARISAGLNAHHESKQETPV